MKIIAFEGMNAAGKSSTMDKMISYLEEKDLSSDNFKIAGFGKSSRVQALYPRIRDIEYKRKEGRLTAEEALEHAHNTIIRKTINIQIEEFRDYLRTCRRFPDYIILDRTPMVSWVYSSTMQERKPYLEEIRDEAIQQTVQLGIDKIIIFDVEPWMSIARTLMRSISSGEKEDQWLTRVNETFMKLGVPLSEREKILEYISKNLAINLRERKEGRPVEVSIKYDELQKQRQSYMQIGNLLRNNGGVDNVVVVDAMGDLKQLQKDVMLIL